MRYEIVIDKPALKFISKQPQKEKDRIIENNILVIRVMEVGNRGDVYK